jgi:branched-chain amino acid transport system ATP-binding protein
MTFLEVRGLVSGYDRGVVLHGVDLDLAAGSVLGLLGRNGVGKSTLIMTLAGLVPPSAGSVRLEGRELAGERPDRIARAGVALVPQGRRVWATLTVAEHLALSSRSRGRC